MLSACKPHLSTLRLSDNSVSGNTRKNMFNACICMAMILQVFDVAHSFPGKGSGTVDDPYQITTVYELDSARHHLNSHFVLMNDIDFKGIIHDSLNNSSQGWPSLGWSDVSDEVPFMGSFNGRGHTIRNLFIGTSYPYNGLFCRTAAGAVIDSINLVNARVYAGQYSGILVGCNYGTIRQCSIHGFLSGSKDGSLGKPSFVGGITGYNFGVIVDCSSSVTIVEYYEKVGGLVGNNNGSGFILQCSSSGSINAGERIGGLVGENFGIISKSFSTAEVKDGSRMLGGLVGFNSSTVNDCYSSGTVSGKIYIGGLIGYCTVGLVNVSRCYSTGKVVFESNGGGLIGWCDEGISRSFWDMETSGCTISAAGNIRSTLEMKSQATFADSGWNFDNCWGIDANINRGYPFIKFIDTTVTVSCLNYQLFFGHADNIFRSGQNTNNHAVNRGHLSFFNLLGRRITTANDRSARSHEIVPEPVYLQRRSGGMFIFQDCRTGYRGSCFLLR